MASRTSSIDCRTCELSKRPRLDRGIQRNRENTGFRGQAAGRRSSFDYFLNFGAIALVNKATARGFNVALIFVNYSNSHDNDTNYVLLGFS